MNYIRLISFVCKLAFFAILTIGCVGCTNRIFVDSKDVTQGGIFDFNIGMNKQEVLEVARNKNVHAIRPILIGALEYSYLNLDTLVSPGDGRAIELDDGHNMKVVYTIAHCKVSARNVLGISSPPSSISIGNSSEDFIVNLKKIINGNHMLTAREVISSNNGSWFVIDKPQQHENGSVKGYDIWSFEVSSIKPAGAEFIVYFSEDSIVRISYSRPRMKVE